MMILQNLNFSPASRNLFSIMLHTTQNVQVPRASSWMLLEKGWRVFISARLYLIRDLRVFWHDRTRSL